VFRNQQEWAVKSRSLTMWCVSGALLAAGGDAVACGQTLFQTGQATRYQSFIARHPATILVYRPGTAGDVTDGSAALYSGLEKAGHKVTVVSAPDTLLDALSKTRFDVVIAPAADMERIAGLLGHGESNASQMLAVVGARGAEATRFPRHVKSDDGLNTYLRSIDDMMTEHGA
jgi:hypothetical protein